MSVDVTLTSENNQALSVQDGLDSVIGKCDGCTNNDFCGEDFMPNANNT